MVAASPLTLQRKASIFSEPESESLRARSMTAEDVREQGVPTGTSSGLFWGDTQGVSRLRRAARSREVSRWETGSQAQARHQTVNTSLLGMLNHYMESLILAQGERWRRA